MRGIGQLYAHHGERCQGQGRFVDGGRRARHRARVERVDERDELLLRAAGLVGKHSVGGMEKIRLRLVRLAARRAMVSGATGTLIDSISVAWRNFDLPFRIIQYVASKIYALQNVLCACHNRLSKFKSNVTRSKRIYSSPSVAIHRSTHHHGQLPGPLRPNDRSPPPPLSHLCSQRQKRQPRCLPKSRQHLRET